ncbi:AMP-binding protein [Kiloniella laminariae]|uniref:AMP-binding protein n=1 Tax=Kiloniella laminariae TaxID=454162 RepID=UPI00035CE91A|nr:AMP-binding protein [Kiloniella laminariae]
MKTLLSALDHFSDKTALVDGHSGQEVSFSTIRSMHDLLLSVLPRETGNLIFILSDNSLSLTTLLLASLASENVVCPLDPALPRAILEKYIKVFSPNLVITSAEPRTLPKELTPLNLRAKGGGEQKLLTNLILEARFYLANLEPKGKPLPSGLRLLLPTSGTTGSAKFVRLSAFNLEDNSKSISGAMQITANDKAFAHLPAFYSYGLSVLLSHSCSGARSILSKAGIMDKEFWQQIQRHNCSFFPGVPFHYDILLKLGLDRLKLPTLNSFSVAGGKLSADKQLAFTQQLPPHIDFYIMYGQTEAAPRITTFNLCHFPEKLGSVGPVISTGQLTISSPEGLIDTPYSRQEGEIIYSGPNVMWGYAETREDLYKAPQLDNILETGDLGYLDDDKFLYITGRTKRISKLYGLRFNLDDIEQSLSRISTCAIIEKDGKIRIYHETAVNSSALKDALEKQYSFPGNILTFNQLEKLPRLPSGKLDYKRL